ncbi:hypothetical protein Pla175_26700 [Pirellulimonas nuda]|uniref:Transposase InsH N-terminal domain-containing protein n=2 Tax=Pirellulimonas nuda TaxID=2528009 RepID=A0A518DCS6_9BACT|nr:hypothetical protein Pla175_26700 [Pirellulimonas nuda]
MGLTDRETVEAIRENPYLQFFIGLEEFTQERPFDASTMVDFRKRFGEEGIQKIAEAIALAALPKSVASNADPNNADADNHDPYKPDEGVATPPPDHAPGAPAHRGQLIADATSAPADIRYPTDASLLNEAREKTDAIIDALHRPLVGKQPRPRTYRQKARRVFVGFAKKKQPGRHAIRRGEPPATRLFGPKFEGDRPSAGAPRRGAALQPESADLQEPVGRA